MSAPNCRVAIPKGHTVPHETYEIICETLSVRRGHMQLVSCKKRRALSMIRNYDPDFTIPSPVN